MPCKHLCAVFRHIPGWNWDSLPHEYKNNPFLCLDDSVLCEFSRFNDSKCEKTFSVSYVNEAHKSCDPEDVSVTELDVPKKSKIRKLRSTINGHFQVIKDYVYTSKDEDMLLYVCENLQSTVDHLKVNLSKSTLAIDDPKKTMTHIATPPACKSVNRLSLSKKRMKGVGRHGSSADKIRRYTSKGMGDLWTNENGKCTRIIILHVIWVKQ